MQTRVYLLGDSMQFGAPPAGAPFGAPAAPGFGAPAAQPFGAPPAANAFGAPAAATGGFGFGAAPTAATPFGAPPAAAAAFGAAPAGAMAPLGGPAPAAMITECAGAAVGDLSIQVDAPGQPVDAISGIGWSPSGGFLCTAGWDGKVRDAVPPLPMAPAARAP